MAKQSPKTAKAIKTPPITLVTAVLFLAVITLAVVNLRIVSSLRGTQTRVNQMETVLNDLQSQAVTSQPAIDVSDNTIAFPEMRIKLPYNNITKTLRYTTDGEMLRVGSSLITDHKIRQLGCSELVRVSLKGGPVYSPWEEQAGSVTLADGRELHLYAAKAFANDQASSKECADEVWIKIKPSQVAEAFKEAQSY